MRLILLGQSAIQGGDLNEITPSHPLTHRQIQFMISKYELYLIETSCKRARQSQEIQSWICFQTYKNSNITGINVIMVQINTFPLLLETYSMCSEAPTMIAEYIFTCAIDLGSLKIKWNSENVDSHNMQRGRQVIGSVGFRIRTRY